MSEIDGRRIEEATARSTFYRFFSLFLLPPGEEARKMLVGNRLGDELGGASEALPAAPGARVKEGLDRLLESAPRGDEELASRFYRVFGHGLTPDHPPYESFYGQAHVFQQTHAIADVAGFMAAFGVKPSGALSERADHVGVECEFMAFLSYKEAYASLGLDEEHVAVTREASKRFLAEHLGRFARPFALRLGRSAADPFYAALAAMLDGFVAGDVEYLGVEGLDEVQALASVLDEDVEELGCGGCEEVLGQERP